MKISDVDVLCRGLDVEVNSIFINFYCWVYNLIFCFFFLCMEFYGVYKYVFLWYKVRVLIFDVICI